MKKYKKLQHNVDESLKNIRDEQLLETLKSQNESLNYEKQKNRQRSFKLAMASSCIVVVLIVAIIGGLLLFRQDNAGNKQYFRDNEVQMESTLSELNSYTSFIDLNNSIDWRVVKYIDNIYKDTLYFVVIGENVDTLENFEITIVVNKNYKQGVANVEYDKIHNISNQKLLYFEQSEYDGLFFFTTNGKIDTTQEVVYIKYTGIGITEESTFIDSITSLLIFS